MKTLRMVIGIICCCLFLVVMVQSCAVGIGNTLEGSGETSGSSGFIFAIVFLISGILGIAGKKSNGAIITAAVLFLLAGIIGTTGAGSYSDLEIWGILSYIFSGIFILSVIISRKKNADNKENKVNIEK
ncbi:MAG: hypothetical protein LKE40_01145 [Spirochaetia bacterium]|nr:hypothetical protein [Spirochaetia bacterium]